MSSKLFSPVTLGPLQLSNRIAIAPMCQYSAIDGLATDWHMIHLGGLAVSGAGLVILEATAVTPKSMKKANSNCCNRCDINFRVKM